jgi:anti-sigma regulatory factor (Ser/Thr protein kinase)
MSRGFEVSLHGGIDAGRDARRAVAARAAALPQSVQDDILLLVTELVTNAVRHGGSAGRPIGLELQRRNGRVRVEVGDHGAAFEPPSAPSRPRDVGSRGGWGLFLVDRIAETWGVRTTRSGKCVWFEMAVAAPP